MTRGLAAVRPVRLGALGGSSIAVRRTLPALDGVGDLELVALASRSDRNARAVRDRFGCRVSASYEELLDRDDIDAVYLSLPNGLHHEWGERVLRAGKHLLCEKPMTTSAADTRALAALATERGLVLRENFAFLHHPQHLEVTGMVARGRIGHVRSLHAAFCFPPLPADDIRYNPGLGGGALLDAGVYPLRAARLLLGPGLSVAGATLRHDEELGVDLAGQVLLTSPDGALAALEFGFQHHYGARYSLWGSTGRLQLDRPFSPPPSWAPVVRIEEQDHVEEMTLPPADQFALSLAAFAAAVRTNDETRDGYPDQLSASVEIADLVDAVRERAVRVPVVAGVTR